MRTTPTRMRRRRPGPASFFLIWSVAALAAVAGAAAVSESGSRKAKESKFDEEGLCKWEDAAGEQKCKEQAQRRRKDPYLPDSTGGRDYIDGNNENDEEEMEEEEEEEYHSEEEEPEDDDGYSIGYYGGYQVQPKQGEKWDVWTHGTKNNIYNELSCPEYDYSQNDMFTETSFERIHTVETWKTFNRIYNEIIGAANSGSDESLHQAPTIPVGFEKHGFQFPIEIKFDAKVGRGVFAKTDIPEGSLLYLSTNNAAFHHGQLYRDFLKALPDRLACDVLIWAFVRWVSLESEHTDEHMVCVDLDEGSFVNSADEDDSYNMALGDDDGIFYTDGTAEQQESLWFGCKMKFYAYRDIAAGEEIRAAYGDFAEANGWMYLGL